LFKDCGIAGSLCSALTFQVLKLYTVLMGFVLIVEHPDQLALLVHIPDPHASGRPSWDIFDSSRSVTWTVIGKLHC